VDTLAVSPEESLRLDFDLACLTLAAARRDQLAKDTPAARQQVAECHARVDRVLDTWNDAVRTSHVYDERGWPHPSGDRHGHRHTPAQQRR
jgi:hypothetical protein